ncbi:hypothetical protein [Zongyangia hominis]|uniref:ABC transporter permease n=1 Tax=Zongyangia hominis TaxID=2763677 RepID=A0A926EFC8_9FIRM|nr:hypothetical protein [Zongyangia hominis]MBC8570821.1 ABC transporter permease [Zongyangia hominis]
MTTKISLSNQQRTGFLFRHAVKRLKGVGFISCIVYLAVFTIPFIIRSVQAQEEYFASEVGKIYGFTGALLFILPVVMPLFTGVMSFQFMHQADRADLYYSLPVRRPTLFFTHFLAGLTVSILPLLVIYLPSAVMVLIKNPFGITLVSLLTEFLTLCLTLFISYTLVCFIGVFTPTVLDHVLYTGGIGAAISLGIGYTVQALSQMLVGFSGGALLLRNFGSLWCNPFLLSYRIFIDNDRYRWPLLLSFLALAVVCLLLSVFGFCRHGCERAGRVGGRTLVKEICKYVGAYVGGLLLSLALGGMTDLSPGVMIVGLLLGSFIAYTIIEAVSMRSFRTFGRSMKGYAVTAVCLLALFSVARFDLMGYQNRVPSTQQIASVSIDYFGVSDTHVSHGEGNPRLTLETPEAIEAVRNLHTGLVESLVPMGGREADYYFGGTEIAKTVTVSYHLKNGLTLQRRYEKVMRADFPYFEALCVVPEFRQKTDLSAMVEPNRFNSFQLYNAVGQKAALMNLDLEKQAELLDAIAKDRASETPQQFARPQSPSLGSIVITATPSALGENLALLQKNGLNSYHGVVVIGTHYENTLALLKKWGFDQNLDLPSGQVKVAYVDYSGTMFGQETPLFLSEPNGDNGYRTSIGMLEEGAWGKEPSSILNPEEIQALLSCSYQQYTNEQGYVVAYVVEGATEAQMLLIPYEKAPEFLKKALDNYEVDVTSSYYEGTPADTVKTPPITAQTIRE